MLSPREDDEDDSHLCIKCNATIIGLENYIKHRKERCGKKPEPKDIPTIDTLEPSYSLGADVFFQSLELQSSVKKTTLARLTSPIPISKGLDRKSSLAVASTSRDLPRMSPLDSNLRGEDWIGGHSLRIGINEDNQTKLINAVASISGNVKKDVPSSSYNLPYIGEEDSDVSEDSVDDDDEEPVDNSKWKPPPNYTGGKWRPDSPERVEEDWDLRADNEPTGAEWKSIAEVHDRDDDYDAPPPSHTKGKWVPGSEKTQIMQTTIQTKGAVQYWCGPCNRRLGSRAMYDKHLMSNLHMKKVLPEHELEFSGHLKPFVSTTGKRAARPSRFTNNSVYSQLEKKKPANKLITKVEKKKRNRKPNYIVCSGCKSRVRVHLMGKHLISHYHFRKVSASQNSEYKQLVLNNIETIVRQSPFQCSPCKFYTNWPSNFMQHWLSNEHEEKVTSISGRYWCSFCKYECLTSEEMLNHLTSNDHSEVVAAINRSMPIVLRKKSVIKCDTCHEEFRYNVEVKRHCQRTAHTLPYSGTDDYQELHKCQNCSLKFKTSFALIAHLQSTHKIKAYHCMICLRTFATAVEAKQHRHTSEHRIRTKEKLKEKGLYTKSLSKKCPYCTEETVLINVLELKDHIQKVHPHIKKTCPSCGMNFTLSQEVSRHVKNNDCKFQRAPLNAAILWNCSQCLYTTDSQAECFFHEVLHSEPEKITRIVKEKEKCLLKYTCPLCPKNFIKASLRHHLRQHTFERPFACSICGANFTRQSSLANHTKNEHTGKLDKPSSTPKLTSKEVPCLRCNEKFRSKAALSRHASICKIPDEKRCPYDSCTYIASSSAQLMRHRKSHCEKLKQHACPFCKYKSDQASHMKNHMRCHEGVKPYQCPHCEFLCGSLENLRKHASRRHPDNPLYQCREPDCAFQTNMATQLKAHLLDTHCDKYVKETANDAAKTHLMSNI